MKFFSKGTTIAMLFLLAAVFAFPGALVAGKYPKDGVFKRLPEVRDPWYYVDNNNWEIDAPDKWTHMMGSMGSTMLLGRVINKYAASALVFTFGLFKEYDDGFREGWSYRDIIANAIGVAASLTANQKYRLLCNFDNEKVLLTLNISIR